MVRVKKNIGEAILVQTNIKTDKQDKVLDDDLNRYVCHGMLMYTQQVNKETVFLCRTFLSRKLD